MLPQEFQHFTVIPARLMLLEPWRAPNVPAIYAFFFVGGRRLLEATDFYNLGGRPPVMFRKRAHLYTGAALGLRDRLRQHMETDVTSSSLRRSLLAIERKKRAISKSNTPACDVKGERSLTAWLCENALIGIKPTEDPFGLEKEILAKHASPLNIAHRRQHPYARALSGWRQAVFPSWKPEKARRIRYI